VTRRAIFEFLHRRKSEEIFRRQHDPVRLKDAGARLVPWYIAENDLTAGPFGRVVAQLIVDPSLVVAGGVTALLASWIVIRKIVVEMPPANRDRKVPVRGSPARAIDGLREHRRGPSSGQSGQRERD
jgi:hypothetical protein